jgi:FtsP/CotA-like multicopper oxidase with cupredoxin domain
MPTRRDLLKLGLVSGAYLLTGTGLTRAATGFPTSPRTTPFITPLPVPPEPMEVPAFSSPEWTPYIGAQTRFYHLVEEERVVQLHPELPPTTTWGYRDFNVPAGSWPFLFGPTFKVRTGQAAGGGVIVRHLNDLPTDPRPFGVPEMTVHLHGGHHPARSDGFPDLVARPGESADYAYPLMDRGFSEGRPDPTERPSTMWYHDHLLDFTGPNVYRGLAGLFLAFDDRDTGNETDPPPALRLPSGDFDVPLVLQDKVFAADGSLLYDPFEHDGFLGDKFLVNGAIQPFLHVKARKYRFRFLNGSNARYYRMFLCAANGNTFPFDQIATEGGLLARPIRGLRSFQVCPAERVEIVVDFSQFPAGTELYFENRLQQDEGRKPGNVLSRGTPLVKLIVQERVPDPSQVPSPLRPFAVVPADVLARATRRTFRFERRRGAWAINGKFVDLDSPIAVARLGQPEIWRLVNDSGGWFHPIHIHLEFMRILRRNGKLPPLHERDGMAKKDTINLGGNASVDAFVQFDDYPGEWVFHCHNIEHEDMFMMARFDVE